jgi:hypothetical protein
MVKSFGSHDISSATSRLDKTRPGGGGAAVHF